MINYYDECSEEQIEKIESIVSGEYIKDPDSKKLFSENVKELRDFCENNLRLKIDPQHCCAIFSNYKYTVRLCFQISDVNASLQAWVEFIEETNAISFDLNLIKDREAIDSFKAKSIDELKQNFIEWLEKE